MIKFINKHNEISINNFLINLGLSKETLIKLRKKLGNILVNNKPCFINFILHVNDEVTLNLEDEVNSDYPDCNISFKIIYEDEYLLIVDKPINIATIPTKSHFENSLAGMVKRYQKQQNNYYTFRALNRLDAGTSGIVIIAKDIFSYNILINKKSIIKEYLAISDGEIKNPITIEKGIKNDFEQHVHLCSVDGKFAKTCLTPLKYYDNFNATLVKLKLETGRTNQIRTHLASISHPLSSDIKYGSLTNFIEYFYLRCFSCSFIHPILNTKLEFILDYNLPI